MNVTNLRKNGKKLSVDKVERLAKRLEKRLKKIGFLTDCWGATESGFKISENRRCFSIDTAMLGYNGRRPWLKGTDLTSLIGWKRTDLPTWEERVDFNNEVNEFFDAVGCTARIVSGPYVIRDVTNGAYSESDWCDYHVRDTVCLIFKLTSDDENEAARIRKLYRAKQARIARERKQGKLVVLQMRYGDSVRSEEVITETEYKERTLEMSTGDFHTHRKLPYLKIAK